MPRYELLRIDESVKCWSMSSSLARQTSALSVSHGRPRCSAEQWRFGALEPVFIQSVQGILHSRR